MKKLLAVLVLLAIAGGVYYYVSVYLPANGKQTEAQGSRRGRGSGEGPIAVIAAEAKRQDVPVTLDAIGTVQALNTVTVRAQVDGKLVKILFKDGQDVKAGDVLAEIDPTTFQASYDQAVAKKAQDEAQLANSRIDLERYERLAKTEYGSRQQADTQRAAVAQLEAQVRSDQAAIDNAKAILGYTKIVAPIDGRTGIRAIDEGNIIHSTDTNGLVTITQLRPISVVFNLPQQRLQELRRAMAGEAVEVDAYDSDNTTRLDAGTVSVIDNQVDQQTGTVRFKSTFPNPHLQLWPGQFVNVRVLVKTLKDAVVVPTSAVQRGPNGPFVYILQDNDTVKLQTVSVGQQDETQSVIDKGVTPPERVVTTGFTRLTDGAKVTVQSGEGSAVSPVPARDPSDGRQRRRQRGSRQAGSGSDPGTKSAENPAASERSEAASDGTAEAAERPANGSSVPSGAKSAAPVPPREGAPAGSSDGGAPRNVTR